MPGPFTAIDHVQLAMPRGQESAARAFYVDVLGMTELPKPAALAARGGCWFASDSVQLHLGIEDDFRPGTTRAFVDDPFGNRIELIAAP